MGFLPFERMRERVERGRANSDTEYFDDLLLWGELLTKVVTAGLIAAIDDDPDRLRYREVHRLVRADGIGDWAMTLDEVLTGPAAQFLNSARPELQALTDKKSTPVWANDAVRALQEAASPLTPDLQPLPQKPSLKEWFRIFAYLRNKTRGHGAQGADQRTAAAGRLRDSIEHIVTNFALFQRPWAHLHQNLSGKYRVSLMSDTPGGLGDLRSRAPAGNPFPDGVFLELDRPRFVDLLVADGELIDFFCPNGGFGGRRYELLSYVTGAVRQGDAVPYLTPPTDLPRSETGAKRELDVLGEVFTNLPPGPVGYVCRESLERDLDCVLQDDRHAVVTLHGPGGIGKTSLALATLHRLACTPRFSVIVWFSARDVDLGVTQPRPVRPDVVSQRDISREYSKLVAGGRVAEPGFKAVEYMTGQLSSATDGPTLFVFDNFETVTAPVDIYKWLDASIRPPNKILITTRLREFNGDFHVEVPGMTGDESEQLISSTARALGIEGLLDAECRRKIIAESDGHPYVMKILLGEIAKAGRALSVPRIVADREDILTALFERTYTSLDATARRGFLTLCRWRSWIPTLGLKAVLLRAANERMDVDAGVDSLRKSSLIELRTVEGDGTEFVRVPLVASLFGQKKLRSDPVGATLDADVELLHAFGPTMESGLRHGIQPHIRKLFAVASDAMKDEARREEILPVLEFVAGRYSPAWFTLAELHAEAASPEGQRAAITCLRRYIEEGASDADLTESWRRIGQISENLQQWNDALHAWSKLAYAGSDSLADVSEAANRINSLLRDARLDPYERSFIIQPVLRAFERLKDGAGATALARLAWLHLNNGDESSARVVAERALALDGQNEYAVKLARRLRLPGF